MYDWTSIKQHFHDISNNSFAIIRQLKAGILYMHELIIQSLVHYQILKGWQLGALCPYVIVYCYLIFNLRYLKNLKLFSIRLKQLFESIVLLFLKAKVILRLKRKISKGNPHLTENWFIKTEMWCATDNHNDTCHTCAKGFLDSKLN